MVFFDKYLICADCGKEFLWDAGEQAWYYSRGLRHEPRHCKSCRQARRDGRRQEPHPLAKVQCECCGAQIYVPFLPHGVKPVYCRMCYREAYA